MWFLFFDPFVQHLFDSVMKIENNTSHYKQLSAKVVVSNFEMHYVEVFFSPLILFMSHCILGGHCFLVFHCLFFMTAVSSGIFIHKVKSHFTFINIDIWHGNDELNFLHRLKGFVQCCHGDRRMQQANKRFEHSHLTAVLK